MPTKAPKTKQKKHRKLERKYILRRFMLVFFMLAVMASGCWYVLGSGLFGGKDSVFTPGLLMTAQLPSERSSDRTVDLDLEDESIPVSSADAIRWNLVLINRDNPIDEDFHAEMKTLMIANGREIQVDSRIYGFTLELFNQAKLDGIDIYPRSGYRTAAYQKELYDNKTAEYMQTGLSREDAASEAATMVQVPGYSEHQTGLAIDISTASYNELDEGFANTPAFRWLDENAHKYGFILRYPENKQNVTGIIYEPWHYRYVGVKHARIMKENGYCLEEYIYALRTGQLDQPTAEQEESDEQDITE